MKEHVYDSTPEGGTDVLKTIEDMYELSYLDQSANGTSITNIWK
jgi:hypothetical protein